MTKRRTETKLEPKVRISRACNVCGQTFILSHPNSPKLMCDECQTALAEMIKDYRQKHEQ